MAEAVSHDSILTQPRNWEMLDADREPVKPFSTYVSQERTCSLSRSEFFCFPKLPAERQNGIVSCCDGPTLYQLMQVFSNIREEDKRLFWSKGDAWYRIDGRWPMRGGWPGDIDLNLGFLMNNQQVEVRIHNSETLRDRRLRRVHGEADQPTEELARGFWQNFRSRFPRATRMVLTACYLEDLPIDLAILV
jgi:hypothetical protein